MADPRRLYRQKVLERMSSPERLDELLEVTAPAGWLALISLGVCLVVTVVWGFLGTVAIKVDGQGILMRGQAVLEVRSDSRGRLREIVVATGDVVEAGQVVATVYQPELELQIELKRQELEGAERSSATQDRRTVGLVGQLRRQQAELREKLANEEALLADALITRDTVLATKEQLAGIDRSLAEYERSMSGEASRIDQIRRDLAELESRLATTSAVRSSYTGRVLEMGADPGDVIEVGQRLVTLEDFDEPIEAVIYIPAREGKKVRPGMEVRVSPSTVKAEEYGFIVGDVRVVSDYPVTEEGLTRVLRNQQLARALAGGGPPIEVVTRLSRDENTESGFAWSSSTGPPTKVYSGTLCTASVVIERKRPAEYVVPFFKKTLGIS